MAQEGTPTSDGLVPYCASFIAIPTTRQVTSRAAACVEARTRIERPPS